MSPNQIDQWNKTTKQSYKTKYLQKWIFSTANPHSSYMPN